MPLRIKTLLFLYELLLRNINEIKGVCQSAIRQNTNLAFNHLFGLKPHGGH